MFELMRSISIDAENGRASGVAFVPADHPLFADHFPGKSLLDALVHLTNGWVDGLSLGKHYVERAT